MAGWRGINRKSYFRWFSHQSISVELLPRVYEIGEVGIPLTINEGCLFETSRIDLVRKALIISGFMRLKEFGKRNSKDDNRSDDFPDTASNGSADANNNAPKTFVQFFP